MPWIPYIFASGREAWKMTLILTRIAIPASKTAWYTTGRASPRVQGMDTSRKLSSCLVTFRYKQLSCIDVIPAALVQISPMLGSTIQDASHTSSVAGLKPYSGKMSADNGQDTLSLVQKHPLYSNSRPRPLVERAKILPMQQPVHAIGAVQKLLQVG